MNLELIIPFIKNLPIPSRIQNTLVWYLLSLAISTDKHTQAFAEEISGRDNSLFSNLLAREVSQSKFILNRATRRRMKKLARKRKKLLNDAPWTVAIIIDSTLHQRFSNRAQNTQKFNHGSGWVWGHQWTNIGILINGDYIPLPPIPFYTQQECVRRGIDYKTEIIKVQDFLRTFSFDSLIPNEEVVVLSDSGYDCKELQNLILSRGWAFVSSLKRSRLISACSNIWTNVSDYFGDGRRRWTSIKLRSYRGKKTWNIFLYKQQDGYLNGVRRQVKLVCSKKPHQKEKYLACSNMMVNVKAIIRCYRLRWKIEIFHRDVKNYLGFEDAGVKSFDSLHNHIHLVYLVYIILTEKFPNMSIRNAQVMLEREGKLKEIKKNNQLLTRIDGIRKLKIGYQSAIQRLETCLAA